MMTSEPLQLSRNLSGEGKKESEGSGLLYQKENLAKKIKLTKNLSLSTEEKHSFLEKYIPNSDLN